MNNFKKAKELPSKCRIEELFKYDGGNLIRAKQISNRNKIGSIVNCIDGNGYYRVSIDYKDYLVHRVIWALHHESCPAEFEIDHINGIRTDNRIENLRLANSSQNNQNKTIQKNNTSGCKGVSWCKKRNKWQVNISIDNKQKYVGRFDSLNEAMLSYNQAALNAYGNFAKLNLIDLGK